MLGKDFKAVLDIALSLSRVYVPSRISPLHGMLAAEGPFCIDRLNNNLQM
jgi:hypothetical protein